MRVIHPKKLVFRKRFCNRCEKLFLKDSKSQKICNVCLKKALRGRFKAIDKIRKRHYFK